MTDGDSSSIWQHLKTVTLFDKNKTKVIDVPKKNIGLFSPSSLLIESLIEYICSLIEKDVTNQKKLYLTICQKLHDLQLIDESYLINDFDFIRNHYQKELYRLVNVAKSVSPVVQRCNIPVPTVAVKNAGRKQLYEWSRFSNEFHELEFIARGGFGEVVKVQNKLDAGIYAIKKICLRYCSINGFIRGLSEVQMLAKLNHPNIVSYKAAWLEPLINKLPSRSSKALCSAEKSYSEKENDSSDVVFLASNHSKSNDDCNNIKSLSSDDVERSNQEYVHSSNPNVKEDDIDKSSFDYELLNRKEDNFRGTHAHTCGQDWAILFIQMQLCHQTLRQWLDVRNLNANPSVNIEDSLNIFLQIVQGVEFIHSKGIVHHDIKPNNIFISKDGREVQVGDFGLSCCLLHAACPDTPAASIFTLPNCPVSITHQPGEIGTKLYAAPEQLNGICDCKSDLYSLGILLFELVYSFHTNMERIEKINSLREGNLPSDLVKNFQNVAKLIKRLIARNVDQRPNATDLLKEVNDMLKNLYQPNDDVHITIKQLREELLRKNEEIGFLKQKLLALQEK